MSNPSPLTDRMEDSLHKSLHSSVFSPELVVTKYKPQL
jgi:hypothetical protein